MARIEDRRCSADPSSYSGPQRPAASCACSPLPCPYAFSFRRPSRVAAAGTPANRGATWRANWLAACLPARGPAALPAATRAHARATRHCLLTNEIFGVYPQVLYEYWVHVDWNQVMMDFRCKGIIIHKSLLSLYALTFK